MNYPSGNQPECVGTWLSRELNANSLGLGRERTHCGTTLRNAVREFRQEMPDNVSRLNSLRMVR